MLQGTIAASFRKKTIMKTQKLAKKTLFVFKKKCSGKIHSTTTTSDPTTSMVTTGQLIV